ncbi:hypothetical protein SAMN05216304_1011035 [Bosea sp. OK403]|uniref:hypothetical protein n=1 Tax=Bosea sp. OK403 TaxID=1855286 RepID=UPI0008F01B58|nr:hypothetical protein [Bosea sp. OK403]SFI13578.1 hypothetical protein SAMN05216304_1011035 [Bosea sp. OK403]
MAAMFTDKDVAICIRRLRHVTARVDNIAKLCGLGEHHRQVATVAEAGLSGEGGFAKSGSAAFAAEARRTSLKA